MSEVSCLNCGEWNDPIQAVGRCEKCGHKLPSMPDRALRREVREEPLAAARADGNPPAATSAPAAFPVLDPAWLTPTPTPPVPAELPGRLRDPLRQLATVLLIGLILYVILTLVPFALDKQPGRDAILGLVELFLVMPLMLSFVRVLPSRRVNALYLRSFANDDDTLPIRVATQRALGGKFRLAGIRDPRNRWPAVVRWIANLPFALAYSTPKYMNLEAGDQWKARLWRTMGDARCVVIDLSMPTRFVVEEVRLSVASVGLERILFAGNPTGTIGEWQQLVASLVSGEAIAAESVRVAIWENTAAGRRAYREQVRAFAEGLPAAPAGVKTAALPLALATGSPDGSAAPREGDGWTEVIVGTVLGSVLMGGYTLLKELLVGAGWMPAYLILLGVFAVFFLIALVRYFIDCGSMAERLKFLATFGLSLALMPVALLWMTHRVRDHAEREIVSNNLKQIGLAMHNYHDNFGTLPPAALIDPRGRKLLSWRVQILPYIEEDKLYRDIRHDEPWDSEWNKQFLLRMPKLYAHRSDESVDDNRAGRTRFQVFVGPGTPFESLTRSRFTSFTRTTDTILVAVARKAVPWTKPDDLDYRPDGPFPELGHAEGKLVQVLLADGSVKALPARTPEEKLRQWIRREGDRPPVGE